MSVRHKRAADVYGELAIYALGSVAQAEAFVFQARDHSVPVLKAAHEAALV